LNNAFPLVFGFILWITVDICLFKAAFSDPGFLPRVPDDEHTNKHIG